MMRETRVTAFEAETRLALLLDLVAQGQTVTIMRRGEAVARHAPIPAEATPAAADTARPERVRPA
jgi:antitoxin (DNA-binding transcriptional repressor) of toxin-antitoxin stability system